MQPFKCSAAIIAVMLMATLALAAKRTVNDHEIGVHEDESDEDVDDPVTDPEDFVWETLMFEDCGSKIDVRVVQLSSCDTSPCQVPVGVPVDVTVEFGTVGYDVSKMVHQASWYLLTGHNDVPVTPEQCEGVDCPFEGPDGLAFTATVTVPSNFPPFHGMLNWKVMGQNDTMLICFKTPIKLYRVDTSN